MFRHRHRHELASAAMQYPSTSPLLQIAILPTSFKLQSKRSLDFAPLVNHRWRLQTIARVLILLGHYNCMSASLTCCSVRSAINTCTRCSAKNTVAMRLAKNAGATSCSIRMLCFRCRSGFLSATHCIGAFVPRIAAIASHLLSQFLARPRCALVRTGILD